MDDLRQVLQHALGASYRIERELGGGGMSRVFLAEEVALGRRVVVKVLPPAMAASLSVERFRREIQLAAGLQHPAIVPVLNADASGALLWFSMPFVQGESLRRRLAQGPLPLDEAVRYFRDLLEALEHAHAQGIVHRDIKPENLLISGRRAVVTDFGVAKAVSASTAATTVDGTIAATAAGTVLGTPAYMAPEQAAGDTVDARTDLYAAGLVLYEMLAGRRPFDATTPQEMVYAHFVEEPRPLAVHRRDVPPALAQLVARMLAKAPGDRPASAAEVLAALDAMSTGSGATAPGVLARRPSRRRLAIGGVALAGLALAGAGAWSWRAHADTGLYPWQRSAPWADSARVAITLVPFAVAATDSALGAQAEQAVYAAMSRDQRLATESAQFTRQQLAIFGVTGAAVTRDTAVAFAKDLASRAYVTGSVSRVGDRYLVSAQLVAARNDSVMASLQRTATPDGIPDAIARVARDVQRASADGFGRLGYPSGTGKFFAMAPEAMRLMTESFQLQGRDDEEGARQRLRDAVQIDPGASWAWFVLSRSGGRTTERLQALQKAWETRERVRAPAYRSMVSGRYAQERYKFDSAAIHYRRMIEEMGDAPPPGVRIDLGVAYAAARRFDLALGAIALERDSSRRRMTFATGPYVTALLDLGRVDEARAEIARVSGDRRPEDLPYLLLARRNFAILDRDFARAEAITDSLAALPRRQSQALQWRRSMAYLRGQPAKAESLTASIVASLPPESTPAERHGYAILGATMRVELLGDSARAVAVVDSILADPTWAAADPLDRPYASVAGALARAGQSARARALLDEWERLTPPEWRARTRSFAVTYRGLAAIVEGKGREAVALIEEGDVGTCPACELPLRARAYDVAGRRDSAAALLERFVTTRSFRVVGFHAQYLPWALVRLGELREEQGDLRAAIARYEEFVALWKDAEPALQPKLQDVRARVDRLRRRIG